MPYINKGRNFTYGVVSTLSNVDSLVSPSAGDTVFCLENNRMMTFDGQVWMCSDFIKLINASGSTLTRGDVVVVSNSTVGGVSTTSTSNNRLVVGPVVFGATVNNPMAIAISGIYSVRIADSTNAADIAYTSITSGAATSTTSTSTGLFGVFVEQKSSGLAKCVIRPRTDVY